MHSILIVTDRPDFETPWRAVLTQAGAGPVEAATPAASLARLSPSVALLVDGGATDFDDDELLAYVALARAVGAPTAVLLPTEGYQGIGELLDDLTQRRVARVGEQGVRVVAGLVRAAQPSTRFEYVTVSPRGNAVLCVLGESSVAELSRPCTDADDQSEIVEIAMSPDAQVAHLTLASGGRFTLDASDVLAEGRPPTVSSAGHVAALNQTSALSSIDGSRLGARVRELRMAAGLTQAELARRTGIHRPNIARVEAGRHTPSLETLARLAAAIGVPTASVLEVDPPS